MMLGDMGTDAHFAPMHVLHQGTIQTHGELLFDSWKSSIYVIHHYSAVVAG